MTTRRAARATFLLLLGGSAWLGSAGAATAQSPPTVSLELLAQTAWVAPTDTRMNVRVLARNDGAEAVDDLDVRIVIGPAIVSRFEYEASLLGGPSAVAHDARFPFEGSIEPGRVRELAVRLDPSTIPALTGVDSGVHAMRVEVRSDGTAVGDLTTSIVTIVREPERPVLLTWWSEFDAPLPLGPDGRLVDPGFEAAIADGGPLAAQARQLGALARDDVPIDLVVNPSLLEQLVRMRDGFERATGVGVQAGAGAARDAADVLSTLGAAAASPSVQASAMPFAAPSIPAMLASGLNGELEAQRVLGNTWTREAIGVEPAVVVERAPEGALSDDALAWLAAKGARVVLADADAVERPEQPNLFAPPPTATVDTTRGTTTLVLPDPGSQALLDRSDLLADPVRAAQAVYGELAVIWREAPVPPPQPDGTPTQRGLALRLPATLPADLWEPLTRRLANAPFLRPVHAQDLVAALVPAGPDAELAASPADTFDPVYVEDVRRLRRDVRALESMLTQPSPVPDRLSRDLAVAQAAGFVADEVDGRAWLDAVARTTAGAFALVTPEVQDFTLTSREGTIPLLMGDPADVPMRVTLELLSPRFTFPDGNRRQVLLDRPNQVVTFRVESVAAGRHPIDVRVEAPSGRTISVQRVYVRSTALNRIALIVTGGAALALLLLWVRRWFRRTA